MPKEPSHPLFQTGVFRFSTATGNPIGYYNPVIDSVFLNDLNMNVLWHETTHRTMSITDGTSVLRYLAAISHALLSNLIEITEISNLEFTGKSLNELKLKSSFTNSTVDTILKRLQDIEQIFDIYYKNFLIPAEFSAIDFSPNNDEDDDSWLLEAEEEKLGLSKKDQVKFMADFLSNLFPSNESNCGFR